METWSLIIGIASLIVGVVSIVLGIYAIIFAKKESENSGNNYHKTKDLLVEIEHKTELIDRVLQIQQTQLVDIINKTLDKLGQSPIEVEEISVEEIDALFGRETVKVEIPNKAKGKTVIIDKISNISSEIEKELSEI